MRRSSFTTELYDPKAFIAHAALLGQGFPHCRKFPTAASRRSLGRVSVPMWPSALSGRLRIVALVGRCPANKLMRHRSIPALSRKGYLAWAPCGAHGYAVLAGVSSCYPPHRGRLPMYYSPVRHSSSEEDSFDLHVLGTPPAFILSQDQTLHCPSISSDNFGLFSSFLFLKLNWRCVLFFPVQFSMSSHLTLSSSAHLYYHPLSLL